MESLRCAYHEIGDGCEAREDESDRSRAQTDGEQRAPDQFDNSTRPGQRTDLDVGEIRNDRKGREFLRCRVQTTAIRCRCAARSKYASPMPPIFHSCPFPLMFGRARFV